MKKNLALFAFISCLVTTNLFAQRANLDRNYFQTSYVDLPTNPILDNAKRTFTSNNRKIFLEGFSRVVKNGTLDFQFDFHGTKIGEVDIRKVKHEKKDKDGKVTATTYTYDVHTSYSSSATITVGNTDASDSYSFSLSESDRYSKTRFSSYSKASNYYNNNRHSIRGKYRTKHRNSMIFQTSSRVNNKYGYVPRTSNKSQHFWIIANKKLETAGIDIENYEDVLSHFCEVSFFEYKGHFRKQHSA